MPLAYMNAYPPTISCSAASLTCRSRCSEGAATLTTQMSNPAMNIASSTTGSISQRRGSGWAAVPGTGKVFDIDRTVRQASNSSQMCPMLRGVMDDVVEPGADEMLLPKVLAALADPHR